MLFTAEGEPISKGQFRRRIELNDASVKSHITVLRLRYAALRHELGSFDDDHTIRHAFLFAVVYLLSKYQAATPLAARGKSRCDNFFID